MLTLFAIFLVIAIGVLSATAVSARKNAVATYMWLGEAGDYAARCVEMSGLADSSSANAGYARQYFDAGFSNITETAGSGDEYVPREGSPYPAPIRLTEFEPVNPGDQVPGGAADQQGYLIAVEAPVLSVSLPLIGSQSIEVPMKYYAVLRSAGLKN